VQELVHALVCLLVTFVAIAVILKPLNSGCFNSCMQALGSALGRILAPAFGLLFVLLLLQEGLRSCSAVSPPALQTTIPPANAPGVPHIPPPSLPTPPKIELPMGSSLLISPPVPDYRAGSYNARVLGTPGINPRTGKPNIHLGEDHSLPVGDPVYAIAAGEVILSQTATGYGHVVVIQHELSDGTLFISIYGHLSPSRWTISKGAVRRGEKLGHIGDDHENGDGTEHLHLGIRIWGRLPDKSGDYFRGYGSAADLGHIDAQGRHSGGQFVAFSELYAHGLAGMTRSIR
jgi:murein DD-endopeptidase MepM/ murein hydrolase activator NlpD